MLLAVTAVFWLAAVVRAWRWRRAPKSPALRAIAIALLSIAVALTLDLPAVQQVLAAGPLRSGTPDNIADLGKQLAIVTGAWACQSLLLHLTRGAEVTNTSERTRARLAITVAVLSTAIYLVPLISPDTARNPESGIAQPFITESRLLVLVYAGTVLFLVMKLCWTHTGSGSLGNGVRIMGTGCGVMVAYALTRIVYFAGAHYGHTLLPAVYRAGDFLQILGLGLIAIGTLIPRLGRAVAGHRARRAYAELEPLWTLVTERVPQVVFATTPDGDATAWQLDRRIIEIQDALVVLAPGLDRPPPVAGGPATSAPAAARLAAALEQTPYSTRVVVGGSPSSDTEESLIAPPEGIDPVRWLVQVSRSLTRTGAQDSRLKETR